VLRFRFVALAAVAAVLLSGCKPDSLGGNGISKQSAEEILARSKAAAAAAGSVHVKGRITSRGEPVTIDMRLTQAEAAAGVITMAGQTIELIRVASAVYVKGSDGFYRSIGIKAMPKQLKGKYLKVRAGGSEFAGLTEFTQIQQIFDLFLASPGPLVKGKKHKLGGVRTIGVTDRGGGRTVHVSLQGEPLPVRISTRPDGGGTDGIDFLEYNQPFVIRAPATSTVVDINRLTQAAT
jgi:hypothetical protein